jgi:tRNA modification GTPase
MPESLPPYAPEGTIAALATAPLQSALGVLRLSGPQAWDIAGRLASGLPPQPQAQHAYVLPLKFKAEGIEIVERAVITLWRAPHSYSGEDMAELSLHGSPLLLRAALSACLGLGARLAAPGEFTYRAYLQGKLDLLQAEAVQRLISAGNLRELAQAGAALRGLQSQRIQHWESELTTLLAGIEVIHDYAADDLDASLDPEALLTPARVAARLAELGTQFEAALESLRRTAGQRRGISVAIVGPPNVGKSTLFNALLGHKRALTSPSPGTTRDYLAEPVEAGGLSFTLVDTAGQRSDAEALEQAGMELARSWERSADIVLWVSAADGERAEPPPEDAAQPGRRIDVLTCCDRLPAWPQAEGYLCVSGRSGQGVAELWSKLQELAQTLGAQDAALPGDREAQALGAALSFLRAALSALAAGLPLDAVATDIYRARAALQQAWQAQDRSSVVNAIFSGFCVGK